MKTPRILIVKLSAVGDVVHTLPALTALRRAFPDAWIGWAVHAGPASLLRGHPDLNECLIIPRRLEWRRLRSEFRALRTDLRGQAGGWDVALDFQGLTKSGLVAWLSGAKRRIGFAGKACRELNALFTNERVTSVARAVIQMNLELLRPLGVKTEVAEARFVWDASDEEYIAAWAQREGAAAERYFVLDPFAGWVTKVWRPERWVSVARAVGETYGLRTLVFYGPHERQEAEALVSEMCEAGLAAVLAPETTLRQFVVLVRQHAALFAGGDTGPMHIAAALGIPTVALFGASDSRRNAPVFSNARFEVVQDLSQPCAGTFHRKCRFHAPGHCLDSITVEQVLDAIARLLC